MFAFILLVSIIGGICYRGRGGGFFSFKNGNYPKLFGLDENNTPYFNYGGTTAARIVWWAIPITLLTYIATYKLLIGMALWKIISIFAAYLIALYVDLLILNHGPYQDLGTEPQTKSNSNLLFWLPTYTDQTSPTKRLIIDSIGLAVTGLGRSVIQSIPLCFISLKFLWLGPIGISMLIAYLIGNKVFGTTADSEFLTGLFYMLSVACLAL